MQTIKIDNFDIINPLLSFNSGEDFYYLQIIKRRKDNPDLPRSERIIKSYFLYKGDLEKFRDNIKALCKVNNARAYLRLNKRNIENIAFNMNRRLADYLISREYSGCQSLFEKICGESHFDPDKKWLIDLDTKDNSIIEKFIYILSEVYDAKGTSIDSVIGIPTINGIHIICKPFNLKVFDELCRINKLEIPEIHKDNPTLLYFNGTTSDNLHKP